MSRRPIILPEGVHAAPGTLAVDAPVPGAAAVYSHWNDAGATPAALWADTSTGMLVRAADDEDRWLAPYAQVANTHVDADGLLALACACRPDVARRHGDLFIAAAEAGDFTAWTGPDAFRLLLVLHQALRDRPGGTALATWVTDHLDALVITAGQHDAERDQAVAVVEDGIRRMRQRDGIDFHDHGTWWHILWHQRHGHRTDTFGAIPTADDLPLWALDTVVPPHAFQLTSERTPQGWNHVLEAPRHSWARTVTRPTVPWPTLDALAAACAHDDPRGQWLTRPAAAQVAFTAVLVGHHSQMPPPQLAERLQADTHFSRHAGI